MPSSLQPATNLTSIHEVLHIPDPDEELFIPSDQLERVTAHHLGIYALGCNPDAEVADWTGRYSHAHERFKTVVSRLVGQGLEENKFDLQFCNYVSAAAYFDPNPVANERIEEIIMQATKPGAFSGMNQFAELIGLVDEQTRGRIFGNLPANTHIRRDQAMVAKAGKIDNSIMKEATELKENSSPNVVKTLVTKVLEQGTTETLDTIYGPKIYFKGVKGELIMVRQLSIGQLSAWKKAYEAASMWQGRGFDHIPVEPILDYRMSTLNGEAHVRTAFLRGSNFETAKTHLRGKSKKQLEKQRYEIKRGLDEIGVDHGHLHTDNFVAVETDGKHRLYVIDFDNASIKVKR